MTNAEQHLLNELNRIAKEVHENHKLLVFIANRFKAGQADFSSEDAAVVQMTQESKDETQNVVEAKERIPH